MIIAVGLVAAVWLSRMPLVSGTFEIDGETVHCAIRNSRGNLNFYAEHQAGTSARGGSSMIRIGDAGEIGTHDPQLSYDAAAKRIRVQVGGRVWEFDPKDHALRERKSGMNAP